MPFDRMAVLLHAPAEYVGHLEEAFTRAAIPYFFSRATRRPHPGGRALLALLACATEGLSARRFAEYLSLAQVPDPAWPTDPDAAWTPPESDLVVQPATAPVAPVEELVADPDAAPVVSGSLRTPARWEQLLVDAAVIGGRDRWARRLDGLASDLARRRAVVADEQEAHARRLDDDLRALGHLRAFALPLIDRLAAFPRRAPWGEWLEHLRALATASLREPRPVLAALAELEPMTPVGPIELDEVQLVLTPRLRDVTEPPPRRRYGRVFVGTTRAARGMTFDVVFVPGLAENVFPGKILEDPLLLDEQRRLLGAGTLVTEAERVEGERLALRLAVGAARRRVWLSYPRVDVEKARRRVPSFYALEVLKAAEGRLPGLDALTRGAEQAAGARLGWPAPAEPRDAIDEAEYDLALLAPLLHADPETTAGTASYLLQANPHLARALRARGRRWLRRWTSADGLVDPDELARAALARHQMSVRSYSPTALQLFASCPYRFFLQAVHRLAPREEPVAIEVLDPLTRGALFHDVQFGVLERLRDDGLLPLRPDAIGEAFGILDAVLDAEAARAREALAPAIPRVWDDEIDGLRADLREWLRRAAADDAGWVPERFELAFGLKADEREHSDPAQRERPRAGRWPARAARVDRPGRDAWRRLAARHRPQDGKGLGQGRGGGGRRHRPPAAPLRAGGGAYPGEAGGLRPALLLYCDGGVRGAGRPPRSGGAGGPGQGRGGHRRGAPRGAAPRDAAARGLPLLRLSSRVRPLRGDPDPAEASAALRVPAGAPRHAIAPAS